MMKAFCMVISVGGLLRQPRILRRRLGACRAQSWLRPPPVGGEMSLPGIQDFVMAAAAASDGAAIL